MAEHAFDRLHRALADIADFRGAAFLLRWDQATYMPPGGAPARSRQLALLHALAHERLVGREVRELLAAAESEGARDDLEADTLRIARRDVEQAAALPTAFIRTFHAHMADTYVAWTEARPADDVARMLPHLERTLELSLHLSQYLGGGEHPADPLIARSDWGFSVATLRPLFARLHEALPPLVREAMARQGDGATLPPHHVPLEAQFAFALDRVREFGYDTRRGRLDATHHPFAIESSIDDVRITVRAHVDDLREVLITAFHESGHGMYHQGIDKRLEATLLADGTSGGVHESQSRTWENRVGRSRAYWRYAFPLLRDAFPDAVAGLDDESFHRTLTTVRPGLIHIDADELTYDLHIIVRFELELELLDGRLAVRDLPDAWAARYAELLGVEPGAPRDGVLQDVHWFSREIGGAFQSYTIGNVLGAQFWEAAERELGDLDRLLERGDFAPLARWQRERIHRHGRRLDPLDLVRDITGGSIDPEPYLRALTARYLST